MNDIRASLGFKGERGYSAYEIAVQNGYTGSEQDWLATLGTSSHLTQATAIYTTSTVGETTFNLPSNYTSNSYVEVYVNGLRLYSDEYTLNTGANTVTLTTPLEVVGTKVEVVVSTMTTTDLPITDTIDSTSTNQTAAGTKSVYDYALNKNNLQVVRNSVGAILPGETIIDDIDYPEGFTQATTWIVGKLVATNNVYYDTADLDQTKNGFPVIDCVALMSTGIRVWLKNTSTTSTKLGHYKILLAKLDEEES